MEKPELINNKYKILKKIGEGAFSKVYQGLEIETSKKIAIKIDEEAKEDSHLWKEYQVYMWLFSQHKAENYGFPRVYYFEEKPNGNVMVMEQVGIALDVLFKKQGSRFTLKTVLLILKNVSKSLELLHEKKFVHRDLKPANMATFLLDKNEHSNSQRRAPKICLLDLGLSTRYLTSSDSPVEFRTNRSFVGTSRYASLAAHEGVTQSSFDDYESLLIIAEYFLCGKVPWMGNKEKTLEIKRQWIAEKLKGDGIFGRLWILRKKGKFGAVVPWAEVLSIILEIFEEMDYTNDDVFDWDFDVFECDVGCS